MNREIIAKTLVGKGKLAIQEKQVIKLEENISKPLGCWIINHKYDSKKIDKNIELNGTYDIQIWYAYDDDQKTNVFYKTITFSGVFLISWKNIKTIDDETKQKVHVIKYPTAVAMNQMNDHEVEIVIESVYFVDVFQDSIITVNTIEEEKEDEIIDEEIVMNVNPNYLTNKKE